MYAEYKNVPVHGVQGCTRSTGVYAVYGERTQSMGNAWSTGMYKLVHWYKLSMSYDTESPQPDDDLYDVAESLQPYISICKPVSVYIVIVELIILGGLENLHSTTPPYQPWSPLDKAITYTDAGSEYGPHNPRRFKRSKKPPPLRYT